MYALLSPMPSWGWSKVVQPVAPHNDNVRPVDGMIKSYFRIIDISVDDRRRAGFLHRGNID
jgi:hypothetical protein